jgi:hypothetical protein
MKYHLIPICLLLALIIIGHIRIRRRISELIRRIEFTIDYGNDFIDLGNRFAQTGVINTTLYTKLISNVDKMQAELGAEGIIAEMVDPLRNIKTRNYQMLINFLPEMRSGLYHDGGSLMRSRFNQSMCMCDDMFHRHEGSLRRQIEYCEKHLYNPLSCFAEGIRLIVSCPVNVLEWTGIISDSRSGRIISSRLFRIVECVGIVVGLIGSVVTILLGYEQAFAILKEMLS